MKLYIPALGDDLRLTSDWSFKLTKENREWTLLDYFYGKKPWWEGEDRCPYDDNVTLKSGTILRIDRIYIRKGAKDYDSVTFRILKTKEKPGCRFWVPLKDANNIEFELV